MSYVSYNEAQKIQRWKDLLNELSVSVKEFLVSKESPFSQLLDDFKNERKIGFFLYYQPFFTEGIIPNSVGCSAPYLRVCVIIDDITKPVFLTNSRGSEILSDIRSIAVNKYTFKTMPSILQKTVEVEFDFCLYDNSISNTFLEYFKYLTSTKKEGQTTPFFDASTNRFYIKESFIPKLASITQDYMGVSPMTGPSALVFALKSKYKPTT